MPETVPGPGEQAYMLWIGYLFKVIQTLHGIRKCIQLLLRQLYDIEAKLRKNVS